MINEQWFGHRDLDGRYVYWDMLAAGLVVAEAWGENICWGTGEPEVAFSAFKPNVNPAYAWEPVLFWRGRKRGRNVPTTVDWIACPITLQKGIVGAKPEAFCHWILDLLGFEPEDEIVDLYPGTGVMGRVVAARRAQIEAVYQKAPEERT
jgi:hypothetical protein